MSGNSLRGHDGQGRLGAAPARFCLVLGESEEKVETAAIIGSFSPVGRIADGRTRTSC